MKRWKYIITISCLLIFNFVYQNVQAQQNIAQEAYAIFEQSCLVCHGENGAYTEALIIEHTALIEEGKVIPGDPDGSVFYQRLIETNVAKRMPQGQPALDPVAIETIRQWILAGAPDWDAVPRPKTDFITTDTMLESIENHVNSLSSSDRSFARYFTLTHLYNAGETTEALNAYRRALSKLINSLSWGREVVKPQPIDTEQTVFYIDLRDYEWDVRNDAWTQIEQAYPYQMTFDAPTQTHLHEKLTTLQQEMNCEVPFVHVDWFLATASLPPLYHDILALPDTDRELEALLEVFVAENLQNAPGKRVWRAGFNESGVSRHNRVVERHTSSYGAYWKSYDFAGSAESQNIFTHPLDFTHDGGEIIFNLPNGLQAYFLVDAIGGRLDVAPTEIVSNPAASDPAVRNGLSCIGCHTQGMKTFEDEVRAVVDKAANPPFDKARALELYVKKEVMDGLIEEDTERYREALEAAGGVFGGIEQIQRFHEAFQGTLSVAHAAAAVGLETEVFLEKTSKNTTLQNLLGALVLENGAIKRDAWTSNFYDVISALNTPDSMLPIVERPERIPGAGVYIPDANLRTAIEEALGKAAGEVITVEDMEKLKSFKSVNNGIHDLTGLQFAANLQSLEVWDNQITDLTPLRGLTGLYGLNLKHNAVSDLSPISELINLTEINLEGNLVSDLSPLKNLKKLRYLQLWDCPVSDLSPLAGLTELTELNLADQRWYDLGLIDLSPLTGLTNMEYLTVHNLKLSSGLTPLAGLINLKSLKFDDNNVTDVTPLANLNNLEHIITWGNPISDFSPLTKLTKLKKVDICGANITDLSFLAGKPELTELYLVKNEITDITPLAELHGLTRLNLEGNNISDVSSIAGLTNLKWLKLTNNPITDFLPLTELFENTNIVFDVVIPDVNLRSAIAEVLGKEDMTAPITLAEITSLTTLIASNKDIHDLTGLEQAVNLEELWISKNPTFDLSPLANLKNLIGLGAWETPISDLSPLADLPKLRWLDFGRTPTDANRDLIGNLDLAPLAGITSLRKLTFYACGIIDISPLANLTELTHLRVGGNREIWDASPVAELINLEHLDFHHDSISDLRPLAGLTKLKHLNLYDNRLVSDLSPLAGLTNLTELRLHRNMISDVSPLSGLINLEILILRNNLISDISPLEGLPEHTHIDWLNNPGASVGGPKIEGPWLWLSIPRKRLESKTDLLAEISHGSVTENEIATKGASEGMVVGDNSWIAHSISSTNRGNVAEMLNALGQPEVRYTVVYGSITIYSQQEQNTNMFVGAEGNHKIWLNGELIREDLSYNGSDIHDYELFFPVTLKQGSNILLVAIDNYPYPERFEAYFGFKKSTEYIAFQPSDIHIPDPNLRATIAETLSKEETAPITLQEITSLTTLIASNKDIKDLTGLEFATNLTEFRIDHNPISNLSPIAALTKMREIYFNDTQITDLSPLASLRDLEVINAAHTRISNLEPLADLKNLKKLDTVHSDISDLSPLAGLTNLTRLYLYDCKATDLSPLKGLTKLTWLGLTHTDNISDFSPLSGLTNLEHLDLSDTEISDLTPLAGLINLETLILNENRIVDVSPLASLRNLKDLQLHKNNISDLSPLARIRESIEVFTWFGNPAFPQGGPNIEGPWLWLTFPGKADKDVDYLATASNNKITEEQIANLGASEGNVIGNRAWSVGMLEPYHPNDFKANKTNLRRLLDSQDAITPNTYGQTFVVYGSMTLYSPRIQQTKIFIGASAGQKIYLNGKLVHQDYIDYAFGAHNVGYRTFFPVTLQKGKNVLLVRLDNLKAHYDLWSLFFGLDEITEYMVLTPGVGFSFSVIEKDFLAGDTFTLNLNAENITDLAGWEGDISYDPNVLEAIEVTEGGFLKTHDATTFFQRGTIDNTTGKITGINIARIAEGGVNGSGTLLSVKFRAKVGGDTYITLENFEFGSSSGDIIPAVPPNITITVGEYPAWDVNQDGRVSILDLILVAQDLGSGTPANLRTDVNRDGVINIQDLILVAQNFGASVDSATASPLFTIDNKELMPAMVQAWIDQASAENDGSIVFQQGIENLERLLASLIPEKTALLANYPNPFNPETWIPYHLAKPADVVLTIYAADGAVVHTIALGHQNVGRYQSRSRAAHWDGKNALGESVASGVYFYTLTVGDFSATRKMLIMK